jgi:hypothetical protein
MGGHSVVRWWWRERLLYVAAFCALPLPAGTRGVRWQEPSDMVVSFLQSRAGRSLCAGAVSALIAGERDSDRSSSAHSINETIATNARRLVRDLPDKSHHRLPLLAALGAGLPAPVAAAELGCSRSYAYAAKQVDVNASDLFERAPHDVTVRSHRPLPHSLTAASLADRC